MAKDLLNGKIDEAIKMYEDDKSLKEIAEHFKCSATYITKRLKAENVEIRSARSKKSSTSKPKTVAKKAETPKEEVTNKEETKEQPKVESKSSAVLSDIPVIRDMQEFMIERKAWEEKGQLDPYNGFYDLIEQNLSCSPLLAVDENGKNVTGLGYLMVSRTKRAFVIFFITSILEKDYIEAQKQLMIKFIEDYKPELLYASLTGLSNEQKEMFGFDKENKNTDPMKWYNENI